MGSLRTRLSAILVGTAVAVAAMTLPATAAHAVNQNGTGWAASWKFFTVKQAHWVLRVPGGFANGFLDDNGASRVIHGSVEDPIPGDNRCVRLDIRGVKSGGLIQEMACNGMIAFNTATSDEPLEFSVQSVVTGTAVVDDRVRFSLNSTTVDPGLGQTGSESTWQYDSTLTFAYTLARPGVRMTGVGYDIPGQTSRVVTGSVQNTDPTGCAEGLIDVLGGFTGFKKVCGTGSTLDFTTSGTGDIDPWACTLPAAQASKCVSAVIAKPN
jgi:hypothetical protein